MKVLITGGMGQLGRAFYQRLKNKADVVVCGKEQLDVTREAEVRAVLEKVQPTLVIHCAALTDVDQCEREPERAFRINSHGSFHVARSAAQVKADVISISSDYVFSAYSSTPYEPDSPPSPLSVYGASKWIGEQLTLQAHPRALIVRTAWLYGGHENDFIEKIVARAALQRTISVVDDQIGSPTYVEDVVSYCLRLFEGGARGRVFHVTNRGSCSRYEMAKVIMESLQLDQITVEPVKTVRQPGVAVRPPRTILGLDQLPAAGLPEPAHWKPTLIRYLQERRQRR
ncbi:dTDP-4-dehydrorhamnose reductase [Alkalihalobacillus oceani]|uniref:dTDP-4-dehydrorhamnose reductase n=1 Tax=Halalkalibacter oceani TaxID=1653776 RepID=A0A9X2DSW9_9BACI|nr:dTDP-4-dehydrorhamnose reductase [Halalkalibacter oceani]MCM3715575.1 dTDP-4-dehydrorhamnose reductase [Halalkalibacter oceani]